MVNVNKFVIKWQLVNFVSQNGDTQPKTLWQYNPSNIKDMDIEKPRYRKIDNTLIVVVHEKFKVM